MRVSDQLNVLETRQKQKSGITSYRKAIKCLKRPIHGLGFFKIGTKSVQVMISPDARLEGPLWLGQEPSYLIAIAHEEQRTDIALQQSKRCDQMIRTVMTAEIYVTILSTNTGIIVRGAIGKLQKQAN